MGKSFVDELVERMEDLTGQEVTVGRLKADSRVSLVVSGGQFVDRTLDEDKIRVFPFQVLTKDKEQLSAFETCEQVVEGLDGLHNLTFGNRKLISLECTTTTNFVEVDAEQKYIYTALFRAELGG